ncbi:hypothetical protein IT401_02450 [Candidatus Nomurabacteria bacterium]|nr:hypothetical protein [Candidatus Nomurabacteria bacterium]
MDTELQTTEESFEHIPTEVKEYIYGDEFTAALSGLCTSQRLTEEETVLFRGTLYGYIAQTSSEEDLLERIRAISKDPTMNQTFISWVKEHVSDKIVQLVTDAYVDQEIVDDEEREESMAQGEKIVPAQIIALQPDNVMESLRTRMTQSATIAPIVRSVTTPSRTSESPSSATPTTPAPAQHIDPYRELPE